ncbi:T9SS type A sorting domain-containing protein [Chryseobacterium binzhouense]|uniref:T9SS type A sorting domain-containing protein n=1 Tax=Chryseobacterium binzhouense TaxID=2593646 RepID=UPI00117FB6DC|nr:T9SS type A sorting domain-containing protein [Chryseobacterium binzhouense]
MMKLFSFIATLLLAINVLAQGYTPIRGGGINSYPTQNGLLCLVCGSNGTKNIIDADLNNYTNMGNLISAIGGNGVSVINTVTTYPAGYITGFNVDLGNSPITVSLLSGITIATYKNGVLQESSTSATLASVPAFGGQKSRVFLHLKTTKAFNEVKLLRANGVAAFDALNVYYAFAFDPAKMIQENNGICDDLIGGSLADVDDNVSSSSNFIAPLSSLIDRRNITDGDKNSYGQIVMPAGLLGSYTIGVLDKNQIYPAGNKAGFVISPADQNTLFTTQTLNNLVIETYLFGQLQDSQAYNNGNGLVNISVLSFGSNKQKLSVTATKPFNEVRLRVNQAVGVNVGTVRVYYAFEEPQNCDCKQYLQTDKTAPLKAKLLTGNLPNGAWTLLGGREQWTGVWNALTGNTNVSKIFNPEKVIDADPNNSAYYFSAPVTLGTTGSLAVESVGGSYPAGTFAGFIIDKGGSLTDWSILSNIRIQLYNGNNLVAQQDNANNGLINIKILTLPSGKTIVGMKSPATFNRIRISIRQGISLNLGMNYNVYNVFVEGDLDGDGTPDCFDICPNGDDSIDTDGDGIPDACDDSNCAEGDKSAVLDADGDGISDACDLDSDNDGILDSVEDFNGNGLYDDDDYEGDISLDDLGDTISNYLDLDSDNDGILDLHESGIPTSVINQIDTDRNGVIDSNVAFGKNGFADILETAPDSGIAKYAIKNTDGDSLPDFLDLTSNGFDYDLYAIGKDFLDNFGFGFIERADDFDLDGIMDPVDTDLINRGAPNSPLSPYASAMRSAASGKQKTTVELLTKVYPNPVKAGDIINIVMPNKESAEYVLVDTTGKQLSKGSFTNSTKIETVRLVPGLYILSLKSNGLSKSYKILVK